MPENSFNDSVKEIQPFNDFINDIIVELEDDLNNWEEQQCFLDDLAEFNFLAERLDDDW